MTLEPPYERRRRLLPGGSPVKDDLQEIYASTEAAYQQIVNISRLIPDIETQIEELQSILNTYMNKIKDDHNDNDIKLDEIIDFCSNISDSFSKLVDTVMENIDVLTEDQKKNKDVIISIANSYKNVKGYLETMTQRNKDVDSIVKMASDRVNDLYLLLQRFKVVLPLFSNVSEREMINLIPRLNLVLNELLSEKGYTEAGVKKEGFIVLWDKVVSHIQTNILNFILVAFALWAWNQWLSTHEAAMQKKIEDQQQTILSLQNQQAKVPDPNFKNSNPKQ